VDRFAPVAAERGVSASRRRRAVRRGLALVAALAAIAAAIELARWPDVGRLAREDPKSTAFQERWRARERAAGRGGEIAWRPVPWSRISDELKLAVVVAEDIDFFSHRGFATAEVKRALAEAWEERELPRGASTITQQLAKNLWLSPSRNPWRKVKEALLTRQLEAKLSKRRILELYLNVVELGPGVWGAEAAARRYFGKPASALGRREAASLAAALPRPRDWHPGVASRGYQRAVERIAGRMERAGWVAREIRAAAAEP
jgi:monofunctional biosynthetic peptidoglycan transglycosylase